MKVNFRQSSGACATMRTKLYPEPSSSTILISRLRLSSHRNLLARSRFHSTVISASNSLLSWASTVMIFALPHEEDAVGLRAGITVTALIQTILVLLYWKSSVLHSQLLASKLRITVKQPFLKSLLYCAAECLLHLSVPVDYFGTQQTGLISYQGFCVLALARNHHTFRFLYWCSRCSEVRSRFVLSIAGTKLGVRFLAKSMLADFPFRVILAVFLGMAVLAGLLAYSSDISPTSDMWQKVWNNVWMMVVTQTTIGYGEVRPVSFVGQTMTLLGCFGGIGVLGLLNPVVSKWTSLDIREVTVAAEVLHCRHISRSKHVFATLLQRWWRLVQIRKRRQTSGKHAVAFFKQLILYRKTVSTVQKVKETVFQEQIHSVESRFARSVNRLKSDIGTINECKKRIQRIVKQEKHITAKCARLLGAHRPTVPVLHHTSIESGDSDRLRKRQKTKIKVKRREINQTLKLSIAISRMLGNSDCSMMASFKSPSVTPTSIPENH